MRDNGPVYVTDGIELWIHNWRFNAWGGNFGADIPGDNDNSVPVQVAEYLGMSVEDHQDYILEKGKLEFNGAGTLVLNWYVGTGFVAAMAFGDDEADAAAKSQLETLFPGRDVYMLDASSLWKAGGGIHCVTNDQPFVRPLRRRPTRRVAPR